MKAAISAFNRKVGLSFMSNIKSLIPRADIADDADVCEQARANMIYFSVFDHEGKHCEKEIILDAVNEIVSTYRESRALKGAIFYMWFDALAGQLRSSVINGKFHPPFGCEINVVDDVDFIVEDIFSEVSSLSHRGRLDVYIEVL